MAGPIGVQAGQYPDSSASRPERRYTRLPGVGPSPCLGTITERARTSAPGTATLNARTHCRIAVKAVLLILLGAAFILAFTHRSEINLKSLAQAVHRAGPLAPIAFIGIYALATIAFVPGSLLTLSGGALFGPVAGTFYNLTGATLGATLAFLAARHLGLGRLRQRIGGRAAQIITGVEREDWRFVAFLRLVPLVPFNLLNYALGLTRIRLTRYVLTTYLAMLPGALAYTYLGYAGREAASGGSGLIRKGLLALALLAAAALLPRLIRRMRATEAAASGDLPGPLPTSLPERSRDRCADESAIPATISIIVPMLNERHVLPQRLTELKKHRRCGCEVILVDGGSQDGSVELARESGFEVLSSPPGRARQMNAGARSARGDVLLFLHADTGLPAAAVMLIRRAFADESRTWGFFAIQIEGRSPLLRVIAFLVSHRSRLSGIATGDQGIFVRRKIFERLNGFPEQPLMEDIEMSRRLKRSARPIYLPARVITSGRRWESRGIGRTIALMWALRFGYWIGVPPESLAKRYR